LYHFRFPAVPPGQTGYAAKALASLKERLAIALMEDDEE